jgi:predicted O-linked N-acetylglucosamine transferase (SPINDLY family)
MAYNTGQGAWVAADDAQYVQKAASFASDLPALSALRAQLRQTVLQSPLYDAKQFAKHLSEALAQMWKFGSRISDS